jgi:hypothetical protein
MESDDEQLACKHCGKPILPGEPWHTVSQMHWECHEEAYPPLDKLIAKLDAKFYGPDYVPPKPRKRPCRPGDGPTARKLAKRLAVLVRDKLGYDVPEEDFWFWVQPPEYRGPRWDLAVWGCHVKSPDIPGGMLMLNSWDTMTNLLKAKHLGLTHDGGMEWGVGETAG